MHLYHKLKSSIESKIYLKKAIRVLPLCREVWYSFSFPEYAPKYAERLYINPKLLTKVCEIGGQFRRSGSIIKADAFFSHKFNFLESDIFTICKKHWVNGESWEAAGAYKRMMLLIEKFGSYDGCKSVKDVQSRYQNLDLLFNEVSKSGTLHKSKSFREEDGILVHIGQHGELYFGGNGNHRLAMAIILELEKIPVQLGTVHINSLELLNKLRKQGD